MLDYQKEKKIVEKNQDAWVYILNKYIEDMEGKVILDAGCGLGGLGIATKKKGANFVGIDISDDIYAAKKLTTGELELLKGDGHEMPFKSDVFDIVVSIGTLEHVKNPDMFVAELFRVLKPKGLIFLFYGPNRKFRWIDNPNHKKIVHTFLSYEDVYNNIKPITEKINLVWRDIIEYRLRNGYVPKAFNSSPYHRYLQFIFNVVGKNDFTIKLLCGFCGLLERISYQPNIAFIGQKR